MTGAASYPDLAGRRVVVTGAANGIGLAVAEAFAANGCHVALIDLDEAAARSVAGALSARHPSLVVRPFGLSVTDPDAVEDALRAFAAEAGAIDVLVNNAGIAANAASMDLPRDVWQRAMDINLTAVFSACQSVGRMMSATGGGCILNMASMYGLVAGSERAAYCVSKAGVVMLTKVLAAEWAALGIRVNAIAPGYVDTGLLAALADEGRLSLAELRARTPLGRLAQPDDIAAVASFLASTAAGNITGQVIVTDGGWTADGYGVTRPAVSSP